jgi:hypothetical protein
MAEMERNPVSVTGWTLATTEAAAKSINMGSVAGLRIYLRTGTPTLLTIYDSPVDSGVFSASQDTTAGSAVTIPVSSPTTKSYDLPACMYAARFIKIVGDQSGTFDFSSKT